MLKENANDYYVECMEFFDECGWTGLLSECKVIEDTALCPLCLSAVEPCNEV